MSREQLIEVILDAYSARPDVKEYFEFFINPDVRKLMSGRKEKVRRELVRSKWGTSKARSSVIKKLVKEFRSFSPGEIPVLDFYTEVLKMMGWTEKSYNFPDPLINCIDKLVTDMIIFADDNGMLDEAITRLESLTTPASREMREHVKRFIKSSTEQTINELSRI